MLLTGLFQAGEGIATSASVFRSGAPADLSFDDVFTDIAFAQIVVQRDIGAFEYQEQFVFVAG